MSKVYKYIYTLSVVSSTVRDNLKMCCSIEKYISVKQERDYHSRANEL